MGRIMDAADSLFYISIRSGLAENCTGSVFDTLCFLHRSSR